MSRTLPAHPLDQARARSRQQNWHRALRLQARVIHALMLRDVLMRFGRHNLGIFWLLGEPLLLIAGVSVLWTLTRQTHGDVGVVPFAVSGYGMLTLFRHLTFRSVHVLRANLGLAFHAHVTLFDVLVARSVLEVIASISAFSLATGPLILFGVLDPMHDTLLVAGAWILGGWFCTSFAMCLAALSEMHDLVERLIQPLMYFSLPLTGAFFMVDWLPPTAQRFVIWSPLVHINEMLRAGLFDESVPTTWSLPFIVASCLGLTVVALLLVDHVAARVDLR